MTKNIGGYAAILSTSHAPQTTRRKKGADQGAIQKTKGQNAPALSEDATLDGLSYADKIAAFKAGFSPSFPAYYERYLAPMYKRSWLDPQLVEQDEVLQHQKYPHAALMVSEPNCVAVHKGDGHIHLLHTSDCTLSAWQRLANRLEPLLKKPMPRQNKLSLSHGWRTLKLRFAA